MTLLRNRTLSERSVGKPSSAATHRVQPPISRLSVAGGSHSSDLRTCVVQTALSLYDLSDVNPWGTPNRAAMSCAWCTRSVKSRVLRLPIGCGVQCLPSRRPFRSGARSGAARPLPADRPSAELSLSLFRDDGICRIKRPRTNPDRLALVWLQGLLLSAVPKSQRLSKQ